MVISQIVEFLKDAEKTAETHKVLDSVIYSEATFGAIYSNLPDYIKGRFNRNASDSKLDYKKRIHLTGAATNPWIRFESGDSFIRFEIGTN